MEFKSDKALTKCLSRFRTFEMYGLQPVNRPTDVPEMLQWSRLDVEVHRDSLHKYYKASKIKRKLQVVKTIVTIIEREELENES